MLSWAVRSYAGRKGQNHDACLVKRAAEEICFIGVADGLGNGSSGQVASSLVLQSGYTYLEKQLKAGLAGFGPENISYFFNKLFFAAHLAIAEETETRPDLVGMASSMCAGILSGDSLFVGNLGNSHCFLYADKKLTCITQNIEASGITTLSSLWQDSPRRLVNGRMLPPEIFPSNGQPATLRPGDILLFCTDGLFNNLQHATFKGIEKLLRKARGSPDEAADKLIEYAYDHGSEDNISMIIAVYKPARSKNMFALFW